MEIKWRIWFEKDGKHVLGKGGAEILRGIKKYGSLSKTSKALGMSYRFTWKYITRMEKALGSRIVERERGGKEGGGARLTELGERLLKMYEERVEDFLNYTESMEAIGRIETRDNERFIVIKLPTDIEEEEVRVRIWIQK